MKIICVFAVLLSLSPASAQRGKLSRRTQEELIANEWLRKKKGKASKTRSPTAIPTKAPTQGDPNATGNGNSPTPSPTAQQTSSPTVAPTEVHVSCEAARTGQIYTTDMPMKIEYKYEVLTQIGNSDLDIGETVDERFSQFLALELVDCGQAAESDIQGMSPAAPDFATNELCEGISQFNNNTYSCYVMEGSVDVYLSTSSQTNKLEIEKQVWLALGNEINGNGRRLRGDSSRKLVSQSSFIDEKAGIVDLYFASLVDGTAVGANKDGWTAQGRSSKVKKGMDPVASAALVGLSVFVLGVVGFATLRKRREARGEEVYPPPDMDSEIWADIVEFPETGSNDGKSSPLSKQDDHISLPDRSLISEPDSGMDNSPRSINQTYQTNNSSKMHDQSYAFSKEGVTVRLTSPCESTLSSHYLDGTSPRAIHQISKLQIESYSISKEGVAVGHPTQYETTLSSHYLEERERPALISPVATFATAIPLKRSSARSTKKTSSSQGKKFSPGFQKKPSVERLRGYSSLTDDSIDDSECSSLSVRVDMTGNITESNSSTSATSTLDSSTSPIAGRPTLNPPGLSGLHDSKPASPSTNNCGVLNSNPFECGGSGVTSVLNSVVNDLLSTTMHGFEQVTPSPPSRTGGLKTPTQSKATSRPKSALKPTNLIRTGKYTTKYVSSPHGMTTPVTPQSLKYKHTRIPARVTPPSRSREQIHRNCSEFQPDTVEL